MQYYCIFPKEKTIGEEKQSQWMRLYKKQEAKKERERRTK